MALAWVAIAGPALAASGLAPNPGSKSPGVATGPAPIRAASVDPAAYLPRYPSAAVLARTLAERLAQSGVNTVYVNAYNVKYGAYYLTSYRFNSESDYGQQDLLGKIIEEAHARGIRVFAALYDHQHRGAWEAEPSWREMTRGGGDYNPPGVDVQYFLSVGNPAFVSWWQGYLSDLLVRYPGLDGVELREPIVNWWGASADYNPGFTQAFQAAFPNEPLGGSAWIRFRERTLTGFLQREVAEIHEAKRLVHVTTVASAYGSGRILSAAQYGSTTGFDLDGLLSGTQRPDALKIEPIWQQWAALYPGPTFTPEWTRSGATQFLRQVRGRVPVVVHIELTTWGSVQPTVDQFRRSLAAAASTPGVFGTDFFSTALADQRGAWPAVRRVYSRGAARANPTPGTEERALILYDAGQAVAGAAPGLYRIYAVFLANLLGHFQVAWDMQTTQEYQPGELQAYDVVFYQANVFGGAPPAFLSDVSTYRGTIVWIGQNLFQLRGRLAIPIHQSTEDTTSGFDGVLYKGQLIPSRGDTIVTTVDPEAKVSAWLTGPSGEVPYVVRSGRFWYVAGSPFDYVEKINGRYLAFADLLHDMLGQDQPDPHFAYLRVEDVNPLSDPGRLRADADVFAAHHVPFMVAFIPFYVDPGRHQWVSVAQEPGMLSALRYVESKGGAILLHGDTHQSGGVVTGLGDEFWDPSREAPLPADSAQFVRARVEQALHEMWAVGLHPLGWVTPEYSASPLDYQLFNDYFSLFSERRIYDVWQGQDYQQWAPYVIDADVFGSTIVPDTLGYVKDPASDPERMVRDARALLTVRGGVAGGFIHLSVPPKDIGWLIERLQRLGYGWLDLTRMPSIVRTSDVVQVAGGTSASIEVPAGAHVQEQVIDGSGALIRSSLDPAAPGHRMISSTSLAPGELLTVAVSTGRTRLLGPPPPLTGTLNPFVRVLGAVLGRGVAAAAAAGVVAIGASYLLLKVMVRRRPEVQRP
jgi:hypothetical protein